jgi:ribosome-interacting GTPase 1
VVPQLLFKEDCTVDDLIDVIEGNRRYVRCLYVYNKVRCGAQHPLTAGPSVWGGQAQGRAHGLGR